MANRQRSEANRLELKEQIRKRRLRAAYPVQLHRATSLYPNRHLVSSGYLIR
jgi:hypothetical protein